MYIQLLGDGTLCNPIKLCSSQGRAFAAAAEMMLYLVARLLKVILDVHVVTDHCSVVWCCIVHIV